MTESSVKCNSSERLYYREVNDMNLKQILEILKNDNNFTKNVTSWVEIPEKEAVFSEFPEIDKRIVDILNKRGINQLYSHQRSAIDKVNLGKNIIVVTPTASGKTMCYNIPIINSIIKNNESRALFLFPTKALAQDQTSELMELITELNVDIKTFTYDGDTPNTARKAIRQAGHIVVTNPDMLHSGILPYHTKWNKLFENLKYIVIDEIHHYRGVFGSHLTNVIRRLKRICEFYGSKPQFICCSATISNPKQLAENIIEEDILLVDNNGAKMGARHIIFYNPPVVNKELGIRKSSIFEVKNIATNFIKNDIKTIIFTKSRLNVEVILTYLKDLFFNKTGKSDLIRGYRGGYLASQRREIEQGLRNGWIRGVVTTNALELGVDIGDLDVCIMCGYPGTISSTWQQAGRAGRRNSVSAVIYVANSSPIDQYIVNNPNYFFGTNPESALVNADNLMILYNHIKCAAFELPFTENEKFGVETTNEILHFMEEARILRHVSNRWFYMSDSFPAAGISLRSASNENFIIIDITEPKHKVIGETDRFSAPMLIHQEAIYIHEGQQYQVEKLDYPNKKAYIRKVDVDYYTDANLAVELKVIDVFMEEKSNLTTKYIGEVMVVAMVTMFKKIKLNTHENIGSGPVNLPEIEMHTSAYFLSFNDEILKYLNFEELQNALNGVANILGNVAPIYLMCSPGDINVVQNIKSTFTCLPTIYIYDTCPGGIGLSEKLYKIQNELVQNSIDIINKCECENGCPSCIGSIFEFSNYKDIKNKTIKLLKLIIE